MHLKLKRTPGLYLVGFMASGKTTVGSMLAERLGWSFIDVDSEIERQEGRPIARLFLEEGEEAFRHREADAIQQFVRQVRAGLPRVVALGGGAFVQERNWQLLRENGITVWLDCPIVTIQRRLGDDTTRPLAADRQQLARLYEERRPLYARADFRVDADGVDIASIVERIINLPIF